MPPVPPGKVAFRDRLGTPLVGNAPKLLLLGSGELGREVAIEAMRLGAEVVAADRYEHAPAMQVAHRAHVLAMTDGPALRRLVESERPDVIVPEIEQIDTAELERLEAEGWAVVPNAAATRATMHRERIRRLAVDQAKVPTSRFAFAEDLEALRAATQEVGFPCLVKSMTSSSGHGMTVVRSPEELEAAYQAAASGGRVPDPRVMVEEFVKFDRELTVLVVRAFDRTGRVASTALEPIAHERPGTVYHESWQPAGLPEPLAERCRAVARSVTDVLGGIGVYGVELFVRGDEVLFSEASPRPHDTGLVTLGSQWNSEFALHARAILGLPYHGPEPVVPAAAHVILSPGTGWAPSYAGLSGAFSVPGVRVHLFGKPEGHPGRRLGIAIARGPDTATARELAAVAAHRIESQIRYGAPRDGHSARPTGG
jgi:phosphoribosylglycinamide formyltransferase 2